MKANNGEDVWKLGSHVGLPDAHSAKYLIKKLVNNETFTSSDMGRYLADLT